MPKPLVSYVLGYGQNPSAFQEQLTAPVLVCMPPSYDHESSGSNARIPTASMKIPLGSEAREPFVLVLRKGADIHFERGISLGRSSSSDLVLDDTSVSRFHAFFTVDELGRWAVQDAGSKNGTLLNDVRLRPEVPYLLTGPANVQFGAFQARFMRPEDFLRFLHEQHAPPGSSPPQR